MFNRLWSSFYIWGNKLGEKIEYDRKASVDDRRE